MTRLHWFLPDTPDIVGLLRNQVSVTLEGLDLLVAWAEGDPAAAATFPDVEHRGDAAKRTLLNALRTAFVTPMEPEDMFTLSRGIDWILNYSRDVVSESQVLDCPPDPVIAEMARLLREAVRNIDQALAHLGTNEDAATAAADAAIKAERRLEHTYFHGMGTLLTLKGRPERTARRELYRRCARIGETVIDVAERIVYAVVKQN